MAGEILEINASEQRTVKRIENIMIEAGCSAGEFTFSGIASSLPSNPGLSVMALDGIVRIPFISLPLLMYQANALIGMCGKAPFHKNMDTVNGEFPPKRLIIKNPEWNECIDKFVKTTLAEKLDCPDIPISAFLSKIMLNQSECHFDQQYVPENEDVVFATMVVQLPSYHTGGEFVVYDFEGNETKHDMGQVSGLAPFNCHYAVHYADSVHKVLPVQSGYRLVLIYSICWPISKVGPIPAGRYITHKSGTPVFQIRDAIKEWNLGKKGFLVYILKHEYKENSWDKLGVDALKGSDRDYLKLLLDANGLINDECDRLVFYIVDQRHKAHFYATNYPGQSSDDCSDCSDCGHHGYKSDESYHWQHDDEYDSCEEDEENDRSNSIKAFYDSPGNTLPVHKYAYIRVKKDNLLNPMGIDEENWDDHLIDEDINNDSGRKCTTYGRYIVIGWKMSSDLAIKCDFLDHQYLLEQAFSSSNVGELKKSVKLFYSATSSSLISDSPLILNAIVRVLREIGDPEMSMGFFNYLYDNQKESLSHVLPVEDLASFAQLLFDISQSKKEDKDKVIDLFSHAKLDGLCQIMNQLMDVKVYQKLWYLLPAICDRIVLLAKKSTLSFQNLIFINVWQDTIDWNINRGDKYAWETLVNLIRIYDSSEKITEQCVARALGMQVFDPTKYIKALLQEILGKISQSRLKILLPFLRELFPAKLQELLKPLAQSRLSFLINHVHLPEPHPLKKAEKEKDLAEIESLCSSFNLSPSALPPASSSSNIPKKRPASQDVIVID